MGIIESTPTPKSEYLRALREVREMVRRKPVPLGAAFAALSEIADAIDAMIAKEEAR